MKVLIQAAGKRINFSKAFGWGKLITIAGSAQLVIQGIGFISAIMIIRLLSTCEYALYTLCNTMLGTMVLLADGGISTGVMSQGGKVWQDPEKLGQVIATGLNLRKKFAVISLLIATPVLLYLLLHHGASWQMSVVLVLALIPAFFTSLSGTLLEVVPKLRQDIVPLQKIQVTTNIFRLILTGLTIFTFPWACIAVLASGVPQIWANIRLRKNSRKYAQLAQSPDPVIQKNILKLVKRMLPGAIYYCASGQITIWLISIFGSTTAVAQVGALGRLVMVLSVFTVLFTTLIAPRFARLPDDRALLMTRFLQIIIMLMLSVMVIVGFVWLYPSFVLWVLGKEYSNLTSEVVLNVAGSCIGLVAASAFSLYTHRGWAIHPVVLIVLSIAAIAGSAALVDISTLHGILLLNIYVAAFEAVMHITYCLIKINQLKTITKNVIIGSIASSHYPEGVAVGHGSES